MTTIEVFDPAMCCPTGVCGPPYEMCEMGVGVPRPRHAGER
jgi:hypothetical protein